MEFNYKVVRSNRKTLTLCITQGELVAKAPQKMSIEHIESFIAQKANWIAKKLSEYEEKTTALARVLDGTHFLFGGMFFRVETSATVKRISIFGDALLVPEKYGTGEKRERAIVAWYKRTAKSALEKRLADCAKDFGLEYGKFDITNAKTKWGSCDGNGNIRLNWRLVMLDGALVYYVIVHELCHTLHHDHSAEFWQKVKKFCPTYKADRKRLKTFSVLTTMYR